MPNNSSLKRFEIIIHLIHFARCKSHSKITKQHLKSSPTSLHHLPSLQVTEETANVLTKFGIKCTFRGEVNVKGKGLLPTFFVSIGDNLEFERENLNASSSFEAQL
jgi:hypothetical protein